MERRIGRATAVALVGAIVIGAGAIGSGVAAAASKKCGKAPFTGSISRTDDGSQPAGELVGEDVESATVFSFGTRKNFTIYLAEHRLDPDDLGSTIEAPPGEVLATIFLRAKDGKALRPGQRLRVPRDSVQVVVDAGGGASATTTGKRGAVRIQHLSRRLVCFTIDYEDQFQRIDGVVRARIP